MAAIRAQSAVSALTRAFPAAKSVTDAQLPDFLAQPLQAVRGDPFLLLAACLLVDFIGCLSYFLVFFGEITDFVWAPIACFFLHYMFGSMLVSSCGYLEEVFFFTDLLPTATIAWCIAHLDGLEFLRKALGIWRDSDGVPP